MARYCDGDEAAFRELYQVVAPRIFGYLARMVRHQTSAADLLQQTFVKLHRARSAYIRGADPIPWIYAIAHRVFLDGYRKAKRDIVELETRPDGNETRGASVESRDHDSEPATIVAALAALAELPDPLRQAVVLMKLEGKSVAEAAEIAGITEGAMRVRAHRGYKALRGRLCPV